jgi:hypothetical protein
MLRVRSAGFVVAEEERVRAGRQTVLGSWPIAYPLLRYQAVSMAERKAKVLCREPQTA